MNEDNEHDLMYSILGRLESFRDSTNGKFRFKLRYPTADLENVWEQTTNPAEVATCKNNKGKPKTGNCGVEGYVPISIGTDEVAGGVGGPTSGFGGLEYNGDKALMDGSWGNVKYSIAARHVTTNKFGVKLYPTYGPDSEESVTELYVYVGKGTGTGDTAMAWMKVYKHDYFDDTMFQFDAALKAVTIDFWKTGACCVGDNKTTSNQQLNINL